MPMGKQGNVIAWRTMSFICLLLSWSNLSCTPETGPSEFPRLHDFCIALCFCYFTPQQRLELRESTSVFQLCLTLSVFQFQLKWQPRTQRSLYDWAVLCTLFLFMRRCTLLLAALHSEGLLSPQIRAWDARLVRFDFDSPLLSAPSYHSTVDAPECSSACLGLFPVSVRARVSLRASREPSAWIYNIIRHLIMFVL